MNDGRRRRARLAASAEADYRNILRWTAEHFGTQQARRYAETLQSAIEELIEGPDVPGYYTWRAVVDVERGSGNVFADLGRPDADAHLLKAELSLASTRSFANAASSRLRPRRSWDCLSLTYRVSCGEAFASIRWSASCAC